MLDFKGLIGEYEISQESGLENLDRPDLTARSLSTGRIRRFFQVGQEREQQKAA